MKMRIVTGCAWLLLLQPLLAPDSAAQEAVPDGASDRFDCTFMHGLQCRAESRAKLLALYGLPSAESRLAAGSEMYRVFILNGWGRHHAAITVERSPGSSPTLTLLAPPHPQLPGSGLPPVSPLSVPLALDDWFGVQRRASLFDRILVPEPVSREPGSITICSDHGPMYFVESVEAGAPDEDRRIRRSGLGGCSEGLARPFAIEVALLAAETIPACAELDEAAFRYLAERLEVCAILSGDEVAAAEVYNLMLPLLAHEQERPSADRLARLLAGAEIAGTGAAAGVRPEQAWLQALAGEGRAYFLVERIHAKNADHATVHGLLRRRYLLEARDEYPLDRVEEAPVQLEWTRGALSRFRLGRLSIGAYAPAQDRCHTRDMTARPVDC